MKEAAPWLFVAEGLGRYLGKYLTGIRLYQGGNMSRTIVHTPWEVARLTDAKLTHEDHDHRYGPCCFETIEDYQRRFSTTLSSWYLQNTCRPAINSRETWRFLARTGPPTDYIRTIYTKPARQQARRELRLARRQHNTDGETDVEALPYRPRHAARWDWS